MVDVSVILPVHNAEKFVAQSIECVLRQTVQNIELLIIVEHSHDNSALVCRQYNHDSRIRIIFQHNLGVAGAKNTGVKEANGEFLAFLSPGDCWNPRKLELHLAHLRQNPGVGVSYCPSETIDESGRVLKLGCFPKLTNVTIDDIFCRNPIGNCSAPVIRKQVFDEIAYKGNSRGVLRNWYFDETFEQSDDIECWLRIATQTRWKFEGILPALTSHRVNLTGLPASVVYQFDCWKRASKKLQAKAPQVFSRCGRLAEAYQLHNLAQQAIYSKNARLATKLSLLALKTNYEILLREPKRIFNTFLFASLLTFLPPRIYGKLAGYV